MHRRRGFFFCIISAACYGALAIFAKTAFDRDVGVVTFLFVRFAIACALLWVIVLVRGDRVGDLDRGDVVGGLLMGAVGYGIQSTLYFLALERIDASLSALLLYAFPAIVTGASILLGRERANPTLLAGLAVASVATLLLLGDGFSGDADTLGVVFGLGAAVAYAAYLLVGDSLLGRIPPLPLAALVTTGAAVAFGGYGLVTGTIDLSMSVGAFLSILGAATVSTVLSIALLMIGIEELGASMASVLSTVEPATTVLLAVVLLDEQASPVQLLGGALLLVAIVLCHRARRPVVELEPLPGVPV